MNTKRRKSERERTYGPTERIWFVKGSPCVVCRCTPSENAHVKGDGASRKADARFIVPLCAPCHRTLHRMGVKSFENEYMINLAAHADDTERRWQEHLARSA